MTYQSEKGPGFDLGDFYEKIREEIPYVAALRSDLPDGSSGQGVCR